MNSSPTISSGSSPATSTTPSDSLAACKAYIHPRDSKSLANVSPRPLSRSSSFTSSAKNRLKPRPSTPEAGQTAAKMKTLAKRQAALLKPKGAGVVQLGEGSAVVQREKSSSHASNSSSATPSKSNSFSPNLSSPQEKDEKKEETFEV